MKMVSKNISLAEDLASFADKEVAEGGYGTTSAYFAELLRARRQVQIDSDVKLLTDSMRGAPGGPAPVDEIVKTCKDTRQQMRKEDWQPQ